MRMSGQYIEGDLTVIPGRQDLLKDCYGINIDIDKKLLEYLYNALQLWKQKPTFENTTILVTMLRKRDLKKRRVLQCFWKMRQERT